MRSCLFLLLLFCYMCSYGQQDKTAIVTSLEKKVTDYFRRGQFEISLKLTDSILKFAPANFDYLRFGYEICLADLHDTARAIRYLEKIVAEHPFEAEYLDQYTWVLLKKKDLKQARSMAERAYQIDRENLSIVVNYAHVLNASGEKDAAMRMYAEADELTYSRMKYERLQRQDFLLLDSIYSGFALLFPAAEQKFNEIANTHREANRIALIIDSLEIVGVGDASMVDHYKRGLEAERAVEPNRHKNISRYCSSLGFYYFQTGDIKTATEYYRSALAHDLSINNDPAAARHYESLGDLLKASQATDSAVYYYAESGAYFTVTGNKLALARLKLKWWNLVALGAERTQAYRSIKDSVLPVLEKYNAHEDLVDVYSYLANAGSPASEPDAQVILLEKAVRVVLLNSLPERILFDVYRQLGQLAMRRNDIVVAEGYLNKAAAQIPFSKMNQLPQYYIKEDLGTLYFKKGEWEKAKVVLNEAIDLLFAIRNTLDRTAKQNIVDAPSCAFIVLSDVCKKLQDAEGAKKALELSGSFVQN